MNMWKWGKGMANSLLKMLPVALTQNQRYDRQTAQIIRKLCKTGSNCVDVGTHRGEILDIMRKAAPQGTHFGFEPLPHLFEKLQAKYSGEQRLHIFPFALSDAAGSASFNYVKTNPAYSGLQKRRYDRPHEEDETITVDTRRLDDVLLSYGLPVQLVKIDVEGGEMGVLRGATGLLTNQKPVIIFEFGLGGSDIYGSTPQLLFDFFQKYGYRVSLMSRWLKGEAPLSLSELEEQFNECKNYYFIAYHEG